MIYLELFLAFFKIGCFSFGGAYGAIPIIRDIVLSNDWLNEETLTYIIAVSESTPGPIMVNLATYIGSNLGGFIGALLSTLAVVFPAFVIILLIMVIFKTMLNNKYFRAVLRGVKPCVTGIILSTGIYMAICNLTPEVKSDFAPAIIISSILFLIMIFMRFVLKKTLSPVIFIIVSAFLGIIIY